MQYFVVSNGGGGNIVHFRYIPGWGDAFHLQDAVIPSSVNILKLCGDLICSIFRTIANYSSSVARLGGVGGAVFKHGTIV